MGSIVTTDDAMRYWLDQDAMEKLDAYVRFIGLRGEERWSCPESFDVFKWAGDWFEIQGYDAPGRRWWVERINDPVPKSQVDAKGVTRDPRADW